MTEHDDIIAMMGRLEGELQKAREARAAASCDLCEDRGELVTKDGEAIPCIDCDTV